MTPHESILGCWNLFVVRTEWISLYVQQILKNGGKTNPIFLDASGLFWTIFTRGENTSANF
jgi:hypothetical protein